MNFLKQLQDIYWYKTASLKIYASKSKANNLVSSIPFLLPTAHTSFLSLHFTRHTTPPIMETEQTN